MDFTVRFSGRTVKQFDVIGLIEKLRGVSFGVVFFVLHVTTNLVIGVVVVGFRV
jgi:hypothetical protein